MEDKMTYELPFEGHLERVVYRMKELFEAVRVNQDMALRERLEGLVKVDTKIDEMYKATSAALRRAKTEITQTVPVRKEGEQDFQYQNRMHYSRPIEERIIESIQDRLVVYKGIKTNEEKAKEVLRRGLTEESVDQVLLDHLLNGFFNVHRDEYELQRGIDEPEEMKMMLDIMEEFNEKLKNYGTGDSGVFWDPIIREIDPEKYSNAVRIINEEFAKVRGQD